MKKISEKTKKTFKIIGISIFLIYVFLLCFTWSVNTHYNTAPDEYMKYDVCRYLVENGKLPHGGDESIRNEIWGISYAFTPILSYMFSAVFMKIVMIFTDTFETIIIAGRFVSVICITLYAFFCYKIADKLFKGTYKWLFTVFTTLLPQLVYLGSYINNDSLALLSISIIVYSWITGMKKDWDLKSCITLAIGIGICALSYYNAYGYILCSVIFYIASCYIKKIDIKEFFKKGIIIALISFTICGWWFIRNFILYDGDFIGLSVSREYGEKYALEPYKPSNRATPAHRHVSLKYMIFDMQWIYSTKDSFIGVFGYMNVVMDTFAYEAYELVFKIGCIGVILKFIYYCINKIKKLPEEKSKEKTEKLLFDVIMIISMIIPVVLSLYYSYFSDYQAQGRYVMPMIIPLMYFAVLGFKNIFDFVIRNEKVKNIVISTLIFIWSIAPTLIYFAYIKNNL